MKGGSAGYFFYETRDGFLFRSIDSVVSPDPKKFNGSAPVAEYVYKPAKIQQTEAEDDRKIKNIAFQSEIDIMKKMRAGAYSSLISFQHKYWEVRRIYVQTQRCMGQNETISVHKLCYHRGKNLSPNILLAYCLRL